MSAASEAAEAAELKELLSGYLTHIPPAINKGSYNLSIEFKAAIGKARKVLTKRGVSNSDLRAQINGIDRYWRME